MIEELILPFQFNFMIKAFLITAIIAFPTSLLSCYLVLKGWSLMGDAISHAVLPGVVISYIIGIPFIIGAFISGMICALTVGFLKENSRIKHDTILGIVFSGMFGFGIVLYTKIDTDIHLDHILFGNILGISPKDLFVSLFISLIVSLFIFLKKRDFLLHAFDPIQSQVMGLNVKLLHYGLLSMISLTIVSTLSAVGIILSIGLLIAPGAISFLIVRRFEQMLLLSILITLISGLVGIYLSFFFDSAPAPTIILILTIIFIITFLISSQKNINFNN